MSVPLSFLSKTFLTGAAFEWSNVFMNQLMSGKIGFVFEDLRTGRTSENFRNFNFRTIRGFKPMLFRLQMGNKFRFVSETKKASLIRTPKIRFDIVDQEVMLVEQERRLILKLWIVTNQALEIFDVHVDQPHMPNQIYFVLDLLPIAEITLVILKVLSVDRLLMVQQHRATLETPSAITTKEIKAEYVVFQVAIEVNDGLGLEGAVNANFFNRFMGFFQMGDLCFVTVELTFTNIADFVFITWFSGAHSEDHVIRVFLELNFCRKVTITSGAAEFYWLFFKFHIFLLFLRIMMGHHVLLEYF